MMVICPELCASDMHVFHSSSYHHYYLPSSLVAMIFWYLPVHIVPESLSLHFSGHFPGGPGLANT